MVLIPFFKYVLAAGQPRINDKKGAPQGHRQVGRPIRQALLPVNKQKRLFGLTPALNAWLETAACGG